MLFTKEKKYISIQLILFDKKEISISLCSILITKMTYSYVIEKKKNNYYFVGKMLCIYKETWQWHGARIYLYIYRYI